MRKYKRVREYNRDTQNYHICYLDKIVVVMIVGPCGAHYLIPRSMEKLPNVATFPCTGVSNGEFWGSNWVSNGS